MAAKRILLVTEISCSCALCVDFGRMDFKILLLVLALGISCGCKCKCNASVVNTDIYSDENGTDSGISESLLISLHRWFDYY